MNTQFNGAQESRLDTSSASPASEGHRYNPNILLDRLAEKLRLADDVALARALELSRPLIGQIRQGKQRVGATMLLRMQELSGIPITKLRSILGDKRSKYRIGGN